MGTQIDTIGARLTPSTPLQITYGAQALAVGRKFATIFAHLAATGATVAPYTVYPVINVGNAAAALAEVNALAGAGSQAGAMAAAFVNANVLVNNSNYPAFRIVFLANSDTSFGAGTIPAAFAAVQNLRSDLLVSPYAAEDNVNLLKIQNFAIQISGIDRDLKGQFGSFGVFGSLAARSVQLALNINSQYSVVHGMPDSNTALVTESGILTSGSNVITGLASTVGIYEGAAISGTGIPAGALVGAVTLSTVTMVDGSDNALPAAANEASAPIGFQNSVSQPVEIVAAIGAASMLANQFPYTPFQNIVAGGLIPPKIQSDLLAWDPAGDSEAFLQAGISPLCPTASGTSMAYVRVRTTYTTLPGNITATSYFDWIDIVKLYDFKEVVYQISQNPPFNNNPGGTLASAVIAARFKDEVIREALEFEKQGAFQNVKQHAQEFVLSVSSVGRFDCYIPEEIVPGLYIIAGNIQGVVAASSFTV